MASGMCRDEAAALADHASEYSNEVGPNRSLETIVQTSSHNGIGRHSRRVLDELLYADEIKQGERKHRVHIDQPIDIAIRPAVTARP